MEIIKKSIAYILIIFTTMIFSSLFMRLHTPINTINNEHSQMPITNDLTPFKLKDTEIINNKVPNNIITPEKSTILDMAKEMTAVKWIPKYTMMDKDGHYTFVKGKTYTGIPYSMGPYQASSSDDFLSKINSSNKILGNDCSGFVSAAWGISRQTTLSLFNLAKTGDKIDGKSVSIISWEDLEPGDALLLEKGNGKGHIILYINMDAKNTDSIHVYEQNIGTIIPYKPIPVAREDIRSKKSLQNKGYFPIRLNS